ncbi:hypothetical protein CDAR_35711 [Caerostris darwini]|uniref:Uncharacterized protein n=1 Tax=Caerostris darwini TaxID=1538125 RepID=A0AAV4VDZ0_9ARAC|nr:hypothetical protein CDAR_35711 [Caerostris darwini]
MGFDNRLQLSPSAASAADMRRESTELELIGLVPHQSGSFTRSFTPVDSTLVEDWPKIVLVQVNISVLEVLGQPVIRGEIRKRLCIIPIMVVKSAIYGFE